MLTKQARLALASALIWFGFGAGGPAHAGGIVLTTPAGLSPGDQFRFVFVTDGARNATSTNIADYDSFVQAQAGGATYNGVAVNWLAIGSTGTVNAIDHIGQTPDPVYLAGGAEVSTSTTTSGLWSGTILHPIDEDLAGTTMIVNVWTGTAPDGTASTFGPLGGDGSIRAAGGASFLTSGAWTQGIAGILSDDFPLYGVSQVLLVQPAAVPEPATLLPMGTALGAVLAYGWFRHRREPRRQRPVRPPDATE
jgi:hypothetical protein